MKWLHFVCRFYLSHDKQKSLEIVTDFNTSIKIVQADFQVESFISGRRLMLQVGKSFVFFDAKNPLDVFTYAQGQI